MTKPSDEVVATATGVVLSLRVKTTCAPATTADWGSTTLILISAAEAAANRQITLVRTRENRMHSSFISRKGLVWTVRASLLALRVRTALAVRKDAAGLPGITQ